MQKVVEYHCVAGQTVNFYSKMMWAKHITDENIFCSMNVKKIRGKIIFEFVHWPLELSLNY